MKIVSGEMLKVFKALVDFSLNDCSKLKLISKKRITGHKCLLVLYDNCQIHCKDFLVLQVERRFFFSYIQLYYSLDLSNSSFMVEVVI